MNPRSRESPPNGYHAINGYSNGLHIDKRNSSDEEDNATRKRVCDSHSLNHGVNYEKTFNNKDSIRSLSSAKNFDRNRIKEEIIDSRNDVIYNGRYKEESEEQDHKPWNKISSNSYSSRIIKASPDNSTETIHATDSGPPQDIKPAFPDYLT